MVKRTRKFKAEFENQVQAGFETGVVVKLYSKKMSDLPEDMEDEIHSVPFHRIWMDGEYEFLDKKELKSLKKAWK